MDPTIQKPDGLLKGKYISNLYDKFEEQIIKIREDEEREASTKRKITQKEAGASPKNNTVTQQNKKKKRFVDIESDYERTMNEQLEVISDEESPSKMGTS